MLNDKLIKLLKSSSLEDVQLAKEFIIVMSNPVNKKCLACECYDFFLSWPFRKQVPNIEIVKVLEELQEWVFEHC